MFGRIRLIVIREARFVVIGKAFHIITRRPAGAVFVEY